MRFQTGFYLGAGTCLLAFILAAWIGWLPPPEWMRD
jgi:hypothetical protein